MKKRLRKKLHTGEFTQYGFHVEFEHPEETFLYDFIDYLEAWGLSCGGGGSRGKWEFAVCKRGRETSTDVDRMAVAHYLIGIGINPKVGPLVDFWLDTQE